MLPYIEDTGVVLVSTKNNKHLDHLLQVLKYAKAKNVPTLIFDDEADNASLNTNESKQSKNGENSIPNSAIFDKICDIRQLPIIFIYKLPLHLDRIFSPKHPYGKHQMFGKKLIS